MTLSLPPPRLLFRHDSAKFLKHTDPGHPPTLYVDKYQDPMRADELPVEDESHWNGKFPAAVVFTKGGGGGGCAHVVHG